MRIALIEDNIDLCQSLQLLLGLCGHEAQSYLRATSALNAFRAGMDADLVITDYYLPDMNGVELIRKLREMHRGLPAILLTGSREEGVMLAARRVPGCAVLHKPMEIEELERCIARLCAQPSAASCDPGPRTAVQP